MGCEETSAGNTLANNQTFFTVEYVSLNDCESTRTIDFNK